MSKRKDDLKKYKLIADLMCSVPADTKATQQFWHFVGEYDPTAAKQASVARKDEIAKRFEAFIAEHVPTAFDVASNWGPMSGFGIDGIVFKSERESLPVSDPRFDPAGWTFLPQYDGNDVCYLARLTLKTAEGEALSDLVAQLLAEVQGPVEFSDFVLDGFGLHKAVGSVVEKNTRKMIPPRVFNTPVGLFIGVPKERLYEMPDCFEAVCPSVVSFSQDVMMAFNREDRAAEDPFSQFSDGDFDA